MERIRCYSKFSKKEKWYNIAMSRKEIMNLYRRGGSNDTQMRIIANLNGFNNIIPIKAIIDEELRKEKAIKDYYNTIDGYKDNLKDYMNDCRLSSSEKKIFNNRAEIESEKILDIKCEGYFKEKDSSKYPKLIEKYYKKAIEEKKSLMTIWEETNFSFPTSIKYIRMYEEKQIPTAI